MGKRAYCAFENTCNHGEIKWWVLQKYLFITLMTPVLLYEVGTTWKEFENVHRHFLQSFSKLRNKNHTSSYILWRDHFPLNTCLKFKEVPHIHFPESHMKKAKRSKGRIKAKQLVFHLYTRYGKMTWKMGCNTLASWCITRFICKWGLFATPIYHDMGEIGGSRVIDNTTYVAPNYKTIFFAECGTF